jgi:hypothetical protein
MVAADLQKAFPGTRGFSVANIWRIRQFYRAYSNADFLAQLAREIRKGRTQQGRILFLERLIPDIAGTEVSQGPILSQAVRELAAAIPWGHHVLFLGRIKAAPELFYYLQATAQFGWTRNVFLNQIKAGAYERAMTDKKSHNFPFALPEQLSDPPPKSALLEVYSTG